MRRDIIARAPEKVRVVGSVGHQTCLSDGVPSPEHRISAVRRKDDAEQHPLTLDWLLFVAVSPYAPGSKRRATRRARHLLGRRPVFESTFRSVPSHVTRSIDAAARLIETELPGWWWNCGHCALRYGASLYVPGSSQIRVNYPSAGTGPDFGPRPEHLRLLHDPKWGKLFDSGFHCDRAGTVPLAMLAVLLEAKIALTLVQPEVKSDLAG